MLNAMKEIHGSRAYILATLERVDLLFGQLFSTGVSTVWTLETAEFHLKYIVM